MSLFEYNLYKKRVKQIYLERANKDQKTTLDTTISLATALTSSTKMISQWGFFCLLLSQHFVSLTRTEKTYVKVIDNDIY